MKFFLQRCAAFLKGTVPARKRSSNSLKRLRKIFAMPVRPRSATEVRYNIIFPPYIHLLKIDGKKLVTCYKGFSSFQFGNAAATFSLDVVTARIIQTNFLRQRSQRRLGINYAWSLNFHLPICKKKNKKAKTCGEQRRNRRCVPAPSASAWKPSPSRYGRERPT